MTPRSPVGKLSRTEDFQAIYREGARHTTPHLVIYTRRNASGRVRLGVVVGRRFGRAVVRNRLRRRLREAARSLAPQIQGGADVVLTPLAGAPDASYRALREGVQAGLAAARILRGDDR